MKKSVITLLLVFVLAMGASALLPKTADVTDLATIKVGVLLPETGTWKATGTAANKALEATLPYVNRYLADQGLKIELEIRDTQSDPGTALAELENLKNSGITTVIGPMISEEALAVLDYANTNGMLLLSPSATARELSLPDHFFRMVGTDKSQVDGLTRIIKNGQQIDSLITIFVDDTYGRGYNDYLNEMAFAQNIEVLGSVAITAESAKNPTVSETIKSLAAGASNTSTAVVVVAPSQMAADLIVNLLDDQKLSAMKWYASADIIGNQTIVENQKVAAFLEQTAMEGLTLGDQGIDLDALPYLRARLDGASDDSPYAITTWDALWLLADTYGVVGANPEYEVLKSGLVTQAANFRNAFGSFNTMDENGDTKGSKYMRYVCIKDGDAYRWKCMGHVVSLGAGEPIVQTIEEKISPIGGEVKIGALLPLTGNRSENGEEIKMILEYAVDQFNNYAKSRNTDLSLTLMVEDTGSDNAQAVAAAKTLTAQGINSIIGPINSAELEAVKPVFDAAGITAISPLSSSMALAQTDRLYRLVLNDGVETKALSTLLAQRGIDELIILYADDSYGQAMVNQMKAGFAGEVVALGYDATNPDLAMPVSMAEAALVTSDPAKTAVLTVSYNEVVELFKALPKDSNLRQLKWYGTDSSASSKALQNDSEAAETAAQLDYTTIDFSPYGDKFDPLYYVINDELEVDGPLKESLISSFDGIWLLGCAYLQEGSNVSPEVLNGYLAKAGFHGLGGVLKLDRNGDRQIGYYKFYHLMPAAEAYYWENNGLYSQDLLKPGVLEMK
ncbi:MAG TPA: hypothetical protein DCY58_04230 [Acetobacterium sp.]|nr:hypothetical protein [Acetobacterium sp.]